MILFNWNRLAVRVLHQVMDEINSRIDAALTAKELWIQESEEIMNMEATHRSCTGLVALVIFEMDRGSTFFAYRQSEAVDVVVSGHIDERSVDQLKIV